jgi:hypothetical protein
MPTTHYFIAVNRRTGTILNSGTSHDVVLVDARNPREFQVYPCTAGVHIYLKNFGKDQAIRNNAFTVKNGVYSLNY